MQSLPIDAVLDELVAKLRTSSNLVLLAAPGAGKTTRVAPRLIEAGILSPKNPEILLLQPRRLATRAVASRIAREKNWELGGRVGYQIRFENRTSKNTQLKLITEGILTRRLREDPYLDGVGMVILDEFHERSIHTDLAMALLRQLQLSAREDLKIVVMSATIDPKPISKYLGDCPVVISEGLVFPVETHYLSKPINAFDFHEMANAVTQQIKSAAAEKFEGPGHILVFLPGAGEINHIKNILEAWANEKNFILVPLHGRLTADAQDLALAPATRRKIILATNVAETSLTIDGVSIVIDSGLSRVNHVDPFLGLERLQLTRISKNSATQRAGRSGRQYPGKCFRVWTTHDEKSMAPSHEPEIMRAALSEPWLYIADQGYSDPEAFQWFESPPKTALDFAIDELKNIGALDADDKITSLGRSLLKWPLAPRLAHLITKAIDLSNEPSFLSDAATLAALLSERDILRSSIDRGSHGEIESDPLLRLELVKTFEGRELDRRGATAVLQVRDQILKVIAGENRSANRAETVKHKHNESSDVLLAKLLFSTFPDRLSRRRASGDPRALMVGGRGIKLSPFSVVRTAELFLALEAQETRTGAILEAKVGLASEVKREWIDEIFPGEVKIQTRAMFETETGRIFSVTGNFFRGLQLDNGRKSAAEGEEAAAMLANFIFEHLNEHFQPEHPVRRWMDRFDFAVSNIEEGRWPLLADILKNVLAEMAYGAKSIKEVLEKPLVTALNSKLDRETLRLFQNEVPEFLVVPTGGQIPIRYKAGQPPTLSVRLQEVFGLTETPRVARGRVPVTMQLLSPGFKPVQVTSDLRSFWIGAYHEVRKELRARYPKHSWPEDPLTAKPVAKGGRKR